MARSWKIWMTEAYMCSCFTGSWEFPFPFRYKIRVNTVSSKWIETGISIDIFVARPYSNGANWEVSVNDWSCLPLESYQIRLNLPLLILYLEQTSAIMTLHPPHHLIFYRFVTVYIHLSLLSSAPPAHYFRKTWLIYLIHLSLISRVNFVSLPNVVFMDTQLLLEVVNTPKFLNIDISVLVVTVA